MRKQAGLREHERGHLLHVVQCGRVAVLVEPGPGIRPTLLRAVPQREECLLAAQCRPLPRDRHDLLGRHVEGFALLSELARGVDEDAVVAAITAQVRNRQEYLLREGDNSGPPRSPEADVTDTTGKLEQSLHLVTTALEQ